MDNSKNNIEFFYEYIYPDFEKLVQNKKFKRVKIFKKLQYVNFYFSRYFSVLTYFVIHLLFIPFKFLDKVFFLKTEYFKNNSNGSSLFFRAAWSCLIVMVVIKSTQPDDSLLFQSIKTENLGIGIGIFFGLYWNARAVFTKKWDYAAGLFNKLCFELPFKSYSSLKEKRIAIHFLQVTLGIDLLLLEIWSHKSYYPCFREVLQVSILYQTFLESFSVTNSYINKDLILSLAVQNMDKIFSDEIQDHQKIVDILRIFQTDLSNYTINSN